jgi:phenylalanyl-tRNA synthetase beta chain
MKISYNWLKNYLDIDLAPEKAAEILTASGLEVEGIHPVEAIPGGLRGVVVGEVLTCQRHPNADRLTLTTVDVGGLEPLHIVCGAPNVAVGQKVAVATVGTVLYDAQGKPWNITKSKIRGELSQGMICAEDELSLGTNHDGILVLKPEARIGQPFADYLGLETDHVLEIGLTPNRIDAASHIGVARDLRAALIRRGSETRLNWPDVSSFQPGSGLEIAVEVAEPEACPIYLGLTISNITVHDSPEWVKRRLLAIGINPINNVVDITNLVLHETGHPLHAFDAHQIKGNKVVVRHCAQDTPFVTLDGKTRALHPHDLMICNAEGPMCIGGVFGGLTSGVQSETTAIFLESAYFNPVSIRKTARRHGLNTDASFRYERGIDPNLTEYALKRAALLICEVSGGHVSSAIQEARHQSFPPFKVRVSVSRIQSLAGLEIPKGEMLTILEALDIKVARDAGNELDLLVPRYRVDVQREADVVEEILRIFGLDHIPFSQKVVASLNTTQHPSKEAIRQRVSLNLNGLGFTEIMNNSLTKGSYFQEKWGFDPGASVHLLNPLSQDLDVLRQTLLFGGLEVVRHNQNRRVNNLKIFEFGKHYAQRDKELLESTWLGLWTSGMVGEEHWNAPESKSGFSYLKGVVTGLLHRLGTPKWVERTSEYPGLEESLILESHKQTIAIIGKVHGAVATAMDVQEVHCALVHWDALLPFAMENRIAVKELPKFPSVRRDLALLLDKQIKYAQVVEAARMADKKWLKEVNLFDVYEGKNLPEGKKSYALSFMLRDEEKTLTDDRIDQVMGKILKSLEEQLGAQLRS